MDDDQEIILPNIVKEDVKEENEQINNSTEKINIPSWDLTPPLDSIDRGQMK